jgi:Zinc finger, C2H2 type
MKYLEKNASAPLKCFNGHSLDSSWVIFHTKLFSAPIEKEDAYVRIDVIIDEPVRWPVYMPWNEMMPNPYMNKIVDTKVSTSDTAKYSCDICGLSFVTQEELETHKRKEHAHEEKA